jgi:hypothetical protein
MALGINETIQGETKTSKHLVYREGVRVQYTKKDKNITACILPAIADINDKASYLSYRQEDDPQMFTKWAVGLKFHPFVNRDQNIISPTSFDHTAYDPIDEFIRVAKADPEYCELAGFGADGKRMPNAYKNPDVRLSTKWSGYIVNSIILYDRDQDSEKSILLQIPNTAFRRSGSAKDGGQQWGLLSELNRKNRKADSGSADSYYWGDITDPKALIPCSLKLTPNPAGGIAIYNMVPIDDEDPVKISRTTLESRYDLDNVLYEITESEMIDRMVYYFSDVPKLLKRAYASRVPNIDRLITSAKAVRVTVEDQDEDNDTIEESFVASSKKNNKVESKSSSKSIEDEEEIGNENTRSFAPEEDDLPAPSKKSKNIVVDEDEDEDIDMSEDKEISVPTRKVSKTSSASESKKVSIRDLMD